MRRLNKHEIKMKLFGSLTDREKVESTNVDEMIKKVEKP